MAFALSGGLQGPWPARRPWQADGQGPGCAARSRLRSLQDTRLGRPSTRGSAAAPSSNLPGSRRPETQINRAARAAAMAAPPSLRDLLAADRPLVVPGVYDALGAKIAVAAGFEAMFQTGYGTSASLFGMPDMGFVGAAETLDNARRICAAAGVPVLVDSDTGYGNAVSVWRLVQGLEAAGAAGMFLEDQRWPKRCGHMRGKEVVGYEEYAEKLRAAADARSSRDAFVIVARTDARATGGLGEAIERGRRNVENGADVVFVEAPASVDEMREIGRSIDAPLVANMIEGGRTPIVPADELHRMGFRLVLYPLSILYAATAAASRAMEELRRTGSTREAAAGMIDFDGFNDLVGLPALYDREARYAGRAGGAEAGAARPAGE